MEGIITQISTKELELYYGKTRVLRDISFDIGE